MGSKKPTTAKLKKKLDAVFSRYIRQKYADSKGYVKCYTCSKIAHWKTLQCGHFVSRQYLATRWDEDNCRPQCVGDNIFGQGRPLDFEERLKKELGSRKVEALKKMRHQVTRLDQLWYNDRIQYYEEKIREIPPPASE